MVTELSERELDVLIEAAQGFLRSTTGTHLGVAQDTVRSHLRRIMKKLHAENKAHAVATALRQGDIWHDADGRLQRRTDRRHAVIRIVPGDRGHPYILTVQPTGPEAWSVQHRDSTLDFHGNWAPTPPPSQRTPTWLDRHCCSYAEAMCRARLAAPAVTVDGISAEELLNATRRARPGSAA